MSGSIISSTGTLPTSLASNESFTLYCGNMGVMFETKPTQASEYANFLRAAWGCGRGYESAFATLTKTREIVLPLPTTSSSDSNLLDCGYSTTINAMDDSKSPVDFWNCGRTYAREYALSDAFSLRPTNLIQYFVFALLILCIFL
ncbi:hypothetical protein SEUBUCD646_0O01460 [Saccharomyces eubayanus]|uniref:Uncharacterized protein n=2 Tax=Saccharomyces TaxID=4930 RepID=A0A6C1EFA7_SACPS|nr:hypothetical protein GRS66_010671 [Saccharomyces pastorianus]CAI1714527.1 hypothetical protein SEUBUCD650_0O01470 [Saccharomyces eubayanus]CAI1747949.1 hypothetical protein SEUBUCD646_0O01460 [Saccharomyces eubayanus]